MTPLIADPPVRTAVTEAESLARQNWVANAGAIARRQQPRAEAAALNGLTWVFARDGHLTCFERLDGGGERWFSGCSVPLLAARAMLKSLDGSAAVACLLAPAHAAQVRVALDQLRATHALFCVVPDARTMSVLLHCADFSEDITRGRLCFASGDAWAEALAATLAATPGLPTPTRFIRMPNADGAQIERLITDAQRVFADQNARRGAAVAALRDGWAPRAAAPGRPRRACVIARSTFRLWDDAGNALYDALRTSTDDATAGMSLHRLDPDDPAGSSHLAVAAAAAESDVVIAADVSRGDAPRLVPDALPWITWVTTRRLPAFSSAGPNDRLLLVDPAWHEAASSAGWPRERIGVAGWPRLDDSSTRERCQPGTASPPGGGLVMIADTCALDAPASLAEFSSHGLLWEKIRHDVLRDPFSLPADLLGYLRDRARLDGIADGTLDLPLFADRLIVPAYQQALADALLTAGLPLQLHGAGWPDLPRFRPHAAGPVSSRAELHDVARSATMLVHAWPTTGAHPIDALDRPVLRRPGARKESFLREARLTLSLASATPVRPDVPAISVAGVTALMAGAPFAATC